MNAVSCEDLIRLVPAVASLPRQELENLCSKLWREQFAASTLLLREGEAGQRLYLLVDGQVEVIKALGTDGERLLGVRGPRSFIGEMSLFSREGVHTASVRARTEISVIAMTRSEMAALLSRQPALAYDVMRTMSQRLDESENLTIRELLEKNRELTRAYEELRAAQAQLLEKERLEAELQVARSIQRSFLPRRAPRLPGYDLGMLIQPVSSVGGDLCDFFRLKGDRLGIAIGDVSGHGVGSALFMALAFSLLRGEASRGAPPDRVLRSVNRQLLAISDSGMFVTLLYGILNGLSREFSYARAGHPPPLVLDARGEPINPPVTMGQPLGLFHDLLLDVQTVTIPPGGRLILVTDGVTEASNADGHLFGQSRLHDTLRQTQGASAQRLCQAAYDDVRSFCGAEAPEDDILLVAVQVA
ncbi:MAG: cyclic nucleotide-binding domain-containing protein [Chloroflexi bacterium]|nr:cyclic nucleotide-binding domain-containing protein [Chloroflexota bacterium]